MNKVAKIFSYIAFVFAFCCLAVGYAAVQDELIVNGTVSVDGWYYKNDLSYSDTDGYSIDKYNNLTISYEYYDTKTRKNYRVTGIAENGFSNRGGFESVSIPKEITTIGENAFVGCKDLKSYTVDTDNENYSSIDGILYNKDGTHLIHYPRNRDAIEIFEIPSNVTTISPKAFDSNKNLLAILATDKVDYMEEANWGAQSRTIVIDNRLGVNIASITYDSSSRNHTIVLNDTTIVKTEITQTGASGTAFDGVVDDADSTEHIVLQSKDNKWLVLDRSVTYAYAVLDSNNVLHIYNRSMIYAENATLENGATVTGVYKTPSNIPGTKHLDDIYLPWNKVYDKSGSDYIIKTIASVIVEDKIAPSTLNNWFSDFRECISFDLEKMDTSRVTTMANMFNTCYKIANLDLTHFKTTHVTTMSGMFSNCSALTALDLSSFSNENLTSIGNMFNADKLEIVYVGEKWLPTAAMSGSAFTGVITGSKGTIFATGANTSAYARIDYDEGLPGYLTYKGDPLVRMAIDGIDIKSVTPASDNSAVVTFSENPGSLVRLVSSISGNTDIYLGVEYKNGEYQITIPANYYTENQLVSVLEVGSLLFACLDEDGTLSVYLREVGIDNEKNIVYFSDGETEKEYSADKVFSTSITVDGVQNIGQPLWTNASADIKKVVFVDEITPKNTAASMFANLTACVEFDLKNLNVSNVTNMSYMFHNCKALTSVLWANDIDTSKLTQMSAMFYGCSAMTDNLLPENWNMTKVTTVEKLYYGCTSLETLVMYDSFDTSNVNTMQDMFYQCTSLKNITWSANFKTSKVARMDSMFAYCETMETLTLPATFNTENVTAMGTMFGFCYKLKNLDFESGTLNTTNVQAMGGMFRSCYELTDDDFDEIFSHFTETTSLTNIGAIFNSCTGLKNFVWPAVLNTEKVTYMRETFQYASNLVTVDLSNMDTRNVTNTQQFFNGCKKLTTIIVYDSWNMDKVTESPGMFSDCNNLVGGNGTTFTDIRRTDQSGSTSVKYAIIDGVGGQPGFLTAAGHTHVVDSTLGTYMDDRVHGDYCSVYGEPCNTAVHTYGDDHKCTVCGHECTHSKLSGVTQNGEEGHLGTCVFCGAANVSKPHIYPNSRCSICNYSCGHSVSEWTSVDDNKHSGTCTVCGTTVSKEHDFTNGACVCGKEEEIPAA